MLKRVAAALLRLSVPVLLILLNVRFAMSPLWLQLEYHRPGFPDDPYGLTLEDRLTYAPVAVDYLVYMQDISVLGNQRFPDGFPLYNQRELQHMRDVQNVTVGAFAVAIVLGIAAAACVYVLWHHDRPALWNALRGGAWLTLALIASIIVLAVVGWDLFFTGFHQIFFEDGTWYFLTSDTLIRLFPEQFWFDTALLIGGLAVVEALVLLAVLRRR